MKLNPGQVTALEPHMSRKVSTVMRDGPSRIAELICWLAMGDRRDWTMDRWQPVEQGLKICPLTVAEWVAANGPFCNTVMTEGS